MNFRAFIHFLKRFLILMTAWLLITVSCLVPAYARTETSLAVCLAFAPDTLDPAFCSTTDSATMLSHLFSGLATWRQDETGNVVIVPECATELPSPVINEDGTVTYTYTLVENLSWSDGVPLTASDFVFAWKRAASSTLDNDFGYKFDVIKGYPDNLAVEAPDDRTIVVTLINDVPYWNELLTHPVYFPVREDAVAQSKWAADTDSFLCNGPYTISSWDHGSPIILQKNPYYFHADTVCMNTIEFHFSESSDFMLQGFQDGTFLFIEDVPIEKLRSLMKSRPEECIVTPQASTFYLCWNINESLLPADSSLKGTEAALADAEIRYALSLTIDRSYIQFEIHPLAQAPASSFISMGIADLDGTEFYQNSGHSDTYVGYFDVSGTVDTADSNYEDAFIIFNKYYSLDSIGMITNAPPIDYLCSSSQSDRIISDYIQYCFFNLGFNMPVTHSQHNYIQEDINGGDYFITSCVWVADSSDPICFLDMWTTTSRKNVVQFGRGNHSKLAIYSLDLSPYGYDIKVENGTWAETYDVLIAIIKTCPDIETRFVLMHIAEDMLMSTSCITPLYFVNDVYMIDKSVHGFYTNPFGYRYFMYTTIRK